MIPVLGVPILNQPERLYAMLQTVDHPVDRLVVVDNGEVVDPTTLRMLSPAERTTLLRFPANQGVAGSWNLIVKATPFAPWWLIANFDVTWPTGALAALAACARRDALVLSGADPEWAAFCIGDSALATVGVWDEMLQPAYFEDNDYERRCHYAGVPVIRSTVYVRHDNSSTIREARAAAGNARTFQPNADYYRRKCEADDYGPGGWDLTRRRELSWD